jgi:cytochrome c biogenesis protein CcmG, thiol:disulfide interchange protein DsbE
MRRLLVLAGSVALVAIIVIGLTKAGGSGGATNPPDSLADAQKKLSGSPQPLAGLHAQANELIGGGRTAFGKRLAALKGHPVVINKWASWCVPCQSEFPVFESVGTARGKDVAFLGVNGTDKDPAARHFLAQRWLPFPSYTDPKEDIAQALEAPKNYPMTVFVTSAGKTAYIHSGPYRSDKQLNDDIDRYLLR